MTLSGQIANKEIYNFLRTATIKCAYFADQSKKRHVRASADKIMATNELPYYKHMAGEYILKDRLETVIKNPQTSELELQIYENTCMTLNEAQEQIVEMENRLVYTSDAFDEMMYVTSLDTKEEIPFTLQNLHAEYAADKSMVHSKTLEAYKLPSRYYELLCERYPAQVDLIKAIVYPVKTMRPLTAEETYKRDNWGRPEPDPSVRRRDYLVSADNFQILNYDDSILAENERSNLTTEMQALVNVIRDRWFVKEYQIEENYATVLWSILWCLLPLGLIAQRYANIKSPFAHDSHVWDYLTSKGLSSYKGYLNLEQTLFLYKNIDYILRNRGKQEVTNILIDNLLNNVGLDIKSKTIVLDTTDVLDETYRHKALSTASQCDTCTKRSWCHKGITDYDCPDRQGIDDLCKPTPIVLTEEFAGASKEKVINMLISQYGYTEDEASKKYERAMLWKDDEVETIKEAFNRDQMTDLEGTTESLDIVIKRENKCGLEPVYNEDVVAQQFNDLRHINGTYAPTKLLEIMKRSRNARFQRLFGKFLTETLLHLGPRDVGGTKVNKVAASYSLSVQSESGEHVLDFGEMIASLYLGYCREFNIEVLFDHIRPFTETTYAKDEAYYVFKDVTQPAKSPLIWENAGRIKRLVEGEDYDVGAVITEDVYRWAPKNLSAEDVLSTAAGHELLTNHLKAPTLNFPIPDQVHLTTAFRFGKPVRQQDLYDAWVNDKKEYEKYSPLCPGAEKIIKVGDIIYSVVHKEVLPADEEMWGSYGTKLVILGEVKDNKYYANNDEIPIVPKYFRWYAKHRSPSGTEKGELGENATTKFFEDGALTGIDGTLPDKDPVLKVLGATGVAKRADLFTLSPNQYYQELEIEKYFPLEDFINDYIDLMEVVVDEKAVGNYVANQFELLERAYCYAAQSQSILVHRATSALLNAVLHRDTYYSVNLTGTLKGTLWPAETVSKYDAKRVTVATYSDWLKLNPELKSSFDTIDKSTESASIWDAFNTKIMEKLMGGCEVPYMLAAVDTTTIAKLRELVTCLSSYKVAFMDVDSGEKSCDSVNAIVSDPLSRDNAIVTHEYIMPILDATWRPRAGGFMTNGGLYYAYTHDEKGAVGKTYYKAVAAVKQTREYGTGLDDADIDGDVVTFEEAVVYPGSEIPAHTYFERINLYDVCGIADRSLSIKIQRDEDSVWYYSIGSRVSLLREVPASEADYTNGVEYDTFISNSLLTKEVRERYKSRKYRKQVSCYDYTWSDPVKSEDLRYWLEPSVFSTHVSNTTKFVVTGVDEVHAISQDISTGAINVNPNATKIIRGSEVVYEQH